MLVRAESPRANLAGFPHEIAEGDMKDEACVLRALEGVRYLFHVAADYRIWARDPGEIIASVKKGLYAANFGSYNKIYGSLAGVIVFLIWMWIGNIALLLGAEFDAELHRERAIAAGHPADEEPYIELRDTPQP